MKIKVQIKRQEKQNTAPYIQHFLYEGDGKLTVADFLAELNRRDPLLTAEGLPASRITYESGCHEKKCGACAMLVNGLPQLACSVFLTCAVQKNGSLTLAPLSKFPVIRDLKVDRATTFEILKKMQIWLDHKTDFEKDWDRQCQYEAGQCLACGCCLEICPNYRPENSFGGAAAMVQAYKVIEQNQNNPHREIMLQQYEDHFFSGCSQSLSCRTICPARLPLDVIQSRVNAALRKQKKK